MMSNSESLFNPQDDSLSERVRAYYSVCRDFSRVQASLKQTKQGRNTDFIGDHDEVIPAYELISQSLLHASSEVRKSDLQRAKEKKLLSDKQFTEILLVQRQYDISQTRNNQFISHSNNLKRS